ncbi:hypothetical protein E3N88_12393 [Mikania micrantha]|uniref:BHLH domain-containing protein n=1 Tax=Mikania micrantha TaxID=192012 RepID=A0A5N6P7D9_9ASTR|nr:hypothetical protein E3N88_12393 [Mikania micrantha]
MDMASSWLLEPEMQDQGFMNQYQMNEAYYYQMEDFSLIDSFSSKSYTEEAPSFTDHQSFQTHKCLEESPNSKQPFNFSKADDELFSFSKTYGFAAAGDRKVLATVGRNPVQVEDHVLAERKRREKLAHRFISLSSLLPDLKKKDKAYVLEVAASYIKELQNRVKELEGSFGTKKNSTKESVGTIKRSRLSNRDDVGSNSDEPNVEESSSLCDPEIEVRTFGCSLLVEIYSRANCISLVKVLIEMQKLGLSVISCSTMPFVDTILLVTIVAQKHDDLILPSADLVKNLKLVI